MVYGIYCIRDDHPRPVLSADASLYETAQQIEQDIAEKIRMAKALEEHGNAYLQKVLAIYIDDGEGNKTNYIDFAETQEETNED